MPYAKVLGQTVQRYFETLPENWGNVSGINLLTDAQLKTLSVLPVVVVKPTLERYQSYGQPEVVVGADAVTYTYPVVSTSAADTKAGIRAEWRDEFTTRLYRDYPLEEVVVMLVLNLAPAAFKTYVGALRTAYTDAVQALNAATTREQALAIVPDWPA